MSPLLTITIECDDDFTPAGKRRVNLVKGKSGWTRIQGYVSGFRFCRFATMREALEWRDNVINLNPQPWSVFGYSRGEQD